ncbi:uncharacterized protein LOC144107024 [Amblyomma americanum]
MGQVQTTEEAAIGAVDVEAAIRPLTREGSAGAATSDAPAVRKASSAPTVYADLIVLDQVFWEEAEKSRKSALALPVEQGDFAMKDAMTMLISGQLDQVAETPTEVGTPQNLPRKSGRKPRGKSRSRHRRAKSKNKSPALRATSGLTSLEPKPTPPSSGGAAEHRSTKHQVHGAKDRILPAAGTYQALPQRRGERRSKRLRHRSPGGAKSPRTLATPASRGPAPPTARLLPSDAQLVAVGGRRPREHEVGGPASFEPMATSACSRAGAVVCVLSLLGFLVAVTTVLALGTSRVLGHRDRIVHDFDNWTLQQFKMARASAASTTGNAATTAATTLAVRDAVNMSPGAVNSTADDGKSPATLRN